MIDGCTYEPRGWQNQKGYQLRSINGKHVLAHRFRWEQKHGPIPDNMCVCHRCDNPRCTNVDHLFLGTRADNNRDMKLKGRNTCRENGNSLFARKTHCPLGHPYDDANTKIVANPKTGRTSRRCLACEPLYYRRYRQKHPKPKHPRETFTRCKNGHDVTPGNTSTVKLKDGSTKRRCRACVNQWAAAARFKRRTIDGVPATPQQLCPGAPAYVFAKTPLN